VHHLATKRDVVDARFCNFTFCTVMIFHIIDMWLKLQYGQYGWNFNVTLKRIGWRYAHKNKSTNTCTQRPSRSHLMLLIPWWHNVRTWKCWWYVSRATLKTVEKLLGGRACVPGFIWTPLLVGRKRLRRICSVIFVKQGQLTSHVGPKNYS